MIDTGALATVAAISALGIASPGPNFMVVAQRALLNGREEALAAVAGVVVVSTLWAGASLFGLSLFFKLFPWMHLLLKVAGAAYLVWAGMKLWLAAKQPLPAATADTPTRAGLASAFRAGLATNLANAKAIAFYTSVFSAAVPAPDEIATLWVALLVVMLIALFWYGAVALVLSSGPFAEAYRRARTAIDRSCGALMIGFGLRLATSD